MTSLEQARKDLRKGSRKRKQVADEPARPVKQPRGQSLRANTEAMRGGNCPFLRDGGLVTLHDHVRWVEEIKNNTQTLRAGQCWLRAANSFCFVTPEGKMADCQTASFLVAWATPLTGGARRVCRALSGYTPPGENLTDEDVSGPVWRMQTEVIIAHVSYVYPTPLQVLGFERNVNVTQATDRTALYVLQNPHPDYERLWKSSCEKYAKAGNKLTTWSDVDITGPRPAWYNEWSWQMLRLEEGYPARHPDDPAQRADLRPIEEKRSYRASRARATEPDEYAGAVDEVGESDASSIELDDSAEFPTGRKWHGGDPPAWEQARQRLRGSTLRGSETGEGSPSGPSKPPQHLGAGTSGQSTSNAGAQDPPPATTQGLSAGVGGDVEGGNAPNAGATSPTPPPPTPGSPTAPGEQQASPPSPPMRATPSRQPFTDGLSSPSV